MSGEKKYFFNCWNHLLQFRKYERVMEFISKRFHFIRSNLTQPRPSRFSMTSLKTRKSMNSARNSNEIEVEINSHSAKRFDPFHSFSLHNMNKHGRMSRNNENFKRWRRQNLRFVWWGWNLSQSESISLQRTKSEICDMWSFQLWINQMAKVQSSTWNCFDIVEIFPPLQFKFMIFRNASHLQQLQRVGVSIVKLPRVPRDLVNSWAEAREEMKEEREMWSEQIHWQAGQEGNAKAFDSVVKKSLSINLWQKS